MQQIVLPFFIIPFVNLIEVDAFFLHSEVALRFRLSLHIRVYEHCSVCIAHQVLPQYIQTVCQMPCPYEIGAEAEANTPIDVVMVEQVSPKDVEAVKMMEHLEGRQVTVLRPAPFFWRLDSIIRILS